MLERCKAYLFDCDGTLVDSEYLAMRICCDTLVDVAARHEVSVDPFFVMSMFGKTIPQITKAVEEKYQEQNLKFPPDLTSTIHNNTVAVLGREVQPTAGMNGFLEFCKTQAQQGDGKLAVVTSSSLDRVLPSLACSGLSNYFEPQHIYSAVTTLPVPEPKPSPAIYIYALDKLGVAPCEAVTFEDSASGVESAKRAGIGHIFGYIGGSHISAEAREAHKGKLLKAGAECVFESWQDAQNFFLNAAIRNLDPFPTTIPSP